MPREMNEDELKEEYCRRMLAAQHAVQSAVAMEMNYSTGPTSPKHLRVGVNSALVEVGALGKLLIDKGLITGLEYYKTMAEGHEQEVERYVEHFATKYNMPNLRFA